MLFGSFRSRFGRGLQPLWQAVCLKNITFEIHFPVGENICRSPYTMCTLCPHNHTMSVSDALSLTFSTPLGKPASTDVNDDTSESVPSCEAGSQHHALRGQNLGKHNTAS